MTDEQARVLARGGNVAVTWLDGRASPGIHVQGDTFAELHRLLAEVASRLHRDVGDSEALDDLDRTVEEVTSMLRFYESALAEREVRQPYHRHDAG
ncbi:hypothetical protein [Plantactinospora sp. B5E13]|uniref:DUF6959 family protein n=1 Tax=unclassified Plantactinospora TaxID=2631981 RepID=UPI00325EE515